MTIQKGALNFGDDAARDVSLRFYGAVDAETDLDNIPENKRYDGMGALVLTDQSLWVFDKDSVAAEASGSVREPAAGTGRWLRVGAALSSTVASIPVIAKKTLTATHTTITAAAASEAINIGTALPANSRIIGVEMHTLTPFSGGTVADFTVDVGTSGDVDALIDGADLFAAAVDGGPATMPQGVRPNKFYAAGAQLIATFRCGSDDVADATAGAVTIDVLYVVLA